MMPNAANTTSLSDNRYAIFPFIFTPYISTLALAAFPHPTSSQSLQVIHQPYVLAYKFPNNDCPNNDKKRQDFNQQTWSHVEAIQVQWLISYFNAWFKHYDTQLVKGEHEPEYFAKTPSEPAQIVFAHGFFASALHEISHWCVAGKKRRLLNDFGYWYAPDGRNKNQQKEFEQVEIVPQAIECLLTLTCNKPFRVSTDNLAADFDTSHSTFAYDVSRQAHAFFLTGKKLPSDAKQLLQHLSQLRPLPLTVFDIERNFYRHR